MYTDLLTDLQCPACYGALQLRQAEQDGAGEIVAGRLACAGCAAAYPIRDGIVDFLGDQPPASLAQVVNDMPLTAWGYERFWRPFALTLLSGEPFTYRRELPLIAALAAPQRGGLYLDVACSNGLYARALARTLRGAPGHVAAVDHSLPMLAEAWRVARRAGLRISFVRAKAQALPVADGAAAGVAIGGSLNEIEAVDASLAEVSRVLSPGGRFVAMTLARAQTPIGRAVQRAMGSGGLQFWTPAELTREFERHHLRTVGRWTYGLVLFTLALHEG